MIKSFFQIFDIFYSRPVLQFDKNNYISTKFSITMTLLFFLYAALIIYAQHNEFIDTQITFDIENPQIKSFNAQISFKFDNDKLN